MTNIERYNEFTKNMKVHLKNRMTWMGLDGRMPKHSINLYRFFEENEIGDSLNDVKNVNDFRKVVLKWADSYKEWVGSKGDYSEEEKKDMWNFFVGAIGELFFLFYMTDLRCLLIKNDYGTLERYDFRDVALRLKGENDYGVDMTGRVSNGNREYDFAGQVKFWQPYSDAEISRSIVGGVYLDADNNEMIDSKEDKNIFICWLGCDKKVSRYLKEDAKTYRRLVFIDMDNLDMTINNKMDDFWKRLEDYLKDMFK